MHLSNGMKTVKLRFGEWYAVWSQESCIVTFPPHDDIGVEKELVIPGMSDGWNETSGRRLIHAITDTCTVSDDDAEILPFVP